MDGSRHQLPLEWLHGPYGYDPYTNTLHPLPYYGFGYGSGVWNPADQRQAGPLPFTYGAGGSSHGRHQLAGAQRGRGRGRDRGRRQPRQHDGPGLLGSDPSSQRPPQLPPPRRRAPADEASSSHQPPAQVQPPPPENMSMDDAHVDASMADAAKDPRAPKKNSDADVHMSRRDDDKQGDVLGLNTFMARKRLLSTKASSLATDAGDEEAKAAATKKTRLGWGQGLAKYENHRYKKDAKTTHKLVAHDGATGEPASSHGSSPPPGNEGHGGNNSLDDMAKGSSSHPLKGDLGNPGSLTEKAVCPAEVPVGFSHKHSPSPAAVIQNLMADAETDKSDISITSISSRTSVAVSELAASSLQRNDAPPDESSMAFTKVEDAPPRHKVIVQMVRPTKIKPINVFSDEEAQTNENDAAPLVPGNSTVTSTKNYKGMNSEAEDVTEPVNQICHDSTANLLAHSLPDKGRGESSLDEHEHATGQVLVGESNAAPSPLGMRSIQAACLTMSRTGEAPVPENFNDDNSSNEAVCNTESVSKVKENVPQSVLIANHGDEGNCVAGGLCGQDTVKIMFFPDESSAKLANDTFNGDHVRNGARTPEEWKATEKKLANSNIDDCRMAPSDMKNPKSKNNPCNTSDPAALLTGPAFVEHMMKVDKEMEKKESEQNDKVKGKETNILHVSSKHGSGIQLSCEVNSQKEMEKVYSIPCPEGNDINADIENPTEDSRPCVASNAAVVRDDGLIQRLTASEGMYRNSENNDAKLRSIEENLVQSVASKECNGIQLSCNVASQKGKGGIISSPEVNDLSAPPMQISNEAPNTFHLPSSSGYAALDIFDANSSYVAMDIDLNIPLDDAPLDVTSVDKGKKSIAEASMGPNSDSEATDSDTTMEMSPSQTAQQQPANQPGSVMLFGRVIYEAPCTGTTQHTPNQMGNQTVVSSSNVLSNPVVPVIRRRGRGQVYPTWATTTSVWRGDVQNNQQGQKLVLPPKPRMLYGGLVDADSSSAASPLQHGAGSRALVNLVSHQRQEALANTTPYNIMRGPAPAVPSPHLIQGSSGGTGFSVNFGFNSIQRQWPYTVVDTSINLVVGYPPSYYHVHGATANQAPATAPNTMLSLGTNNGEGASTSNTRAPPPAAGRGRGRGRGRGSGPNAWLSLRGNNQE